MRPRHGAACSHPMSSLAPLLLATEQTAAMLGVTREVVSELIGQGELRAIEVLTFGRGRIPREEVEGYVARPCHVCTTLRSIMARSGVPSAPASIAVRGYRAPPAVTRLKHSGSAR